MFKYFEIKIDLSYINKYFNFSIEKLNNLKYRMDINLYYYLIQYLKTKNNFTSLTLKVSNNDNIMYIKELISKSINLHPQLQRLIYNGKQLIDYYTINDYVIKENSKIILLGTLFGY